MKTIKKNLMFIPKLICPTYTQESTQVLVQIVCQCMLQGFSTKSIFLRGPTDIGFNILLLLLLYYIKTKTSYVCPRLDSIAIVNRPWRNPVKSRNK